MVPGGYINEAILGFMEFQKVTEIEYCVPVATYQFFKPQFLRTQCRDDANRMKFFSFEIRDYQLTTQKDRLGRNPAY
jgi:hypothetical protein